MDLPMMCKLKVCFFFILTVNFCIANMASPIVKGSTNATAFSSKDVTILHENILVHISQDFKTAKFTLEYTIKSDVVGGQIPLLFLAREYKNGFTVWLDGKPIAIQDIPQHYYKTQNSPFANFTNSFSETIDSNQYISIDWQRNNTELYNLDDLKYFEANLSKGEHKIKVEYLANVWIDNSNWVKEYRFLYSLAPAKYWKSFGSIDITVVQDGQLKPITTNLGNPIEGKIGAISTWKFNNLPSDMIEIKYKSEISKTAQTLISIEPFGIMMYCGLLLFIIHIILIFWYRKRNVTQKQSLVVILGSIIVPILMLYCYMKSYTFIDNLIGIEASKRHGYYILMVVVYPVMLIIYMLITWVIDLIIRRKLTKSIQ
jgi:hypothetical protein